jgi:SPP1 family predicted phage head-tail adaptor
MTFNARKLQHRVTFATRAIGDDGYGNERDGFEDQFTVWAGLTYLRGSEAVIASRLEGRQPVVIRVRKSPDTKGITTDWRAQVASGETFNIRTIVPTDDRRFFDITAESGGAD